MNCDVIQAPQRHLSCFDLGQNISDKGIDLIIIPDDSQGGQIPIDVTGIDDALFRNSLGAFHIDVLDFPVGGNQKTAEDQPNRENAVPSKVSLTFVCSSGFRKVFTFF